MRSSILLASVVGIASTAAGAIVSHSFTTAGKPNGGFTIPRDTPDGVYSVRVHNDGTANHTFVSHVDGQTATSIAVNRSSSSQPPPPPLPRPLRNPQRNGGAVLARRGTWGINCGNHGHMDPNNVRGAVDGLAAMCGTERGGTAPGGDVYVYALQSSMAAYFCVFAGPSRACYDSESRWAFEQITRVCGSMVEGWLDWWNVRTTEYSYGYQNVNYAVEFCGRRHG